MPPPTLSLHELGADRISFSRAAQPAERKKKEREEIASGERIARYHKRCSLAGLILSDVLNPLHARVRRRIKAL